jgi:hypothetical protein
MDPDDLDQRLDLGLWCPQHDRPSVGAQPPGQQRQVHHQRGVGEREVGQVDDDVGLRTDRPRQRPAPTSLGAAVLVARATKQWGLLAEDYDRVKLSEAEDS